MGLGVLLRRRLQDRGVRRGQAPDQRAAAAGRRPQEGRPRQDGLYHRVQIPSLAGEQTFVDSFLSEEFFIRALGCIASREYDAWAFPTAKAVLSSLTPRAAQSEAGVRGGAMPQRPEQPEHHIYFIDFEYSRSNFVAYDIANFLNESRVDYTAKQLVLRSARARPRNGHRGRLPGLLPGWARTARRSPGSRQRAGAVQLLLGCLEPHDGERPLGLRLH